MFTPCKHENFHATVNVNRLVDEKHPEKVNAFLAEITVRCIDCDLPFEWVGLTAGISGEKPMVDVAAQELRAPIKPKGCALMPGIPGISIRAN